MPAFFSSHFCGPSPLQGQKKTFGHSKKSPAKPSKLISCSEKVVHFCLFVSGVPPVPKVMKTPAKPSANKTMETTIYSLNKDCGRLQFQKTTVFVLALMLSRRNDVKLEQKRRNLWIIGGTCILISNQ